MVDQFTKNFGEFFVKLLILTLILNFGVIFSSENIKEKEAIINAAVVTNTRLKQETTDHSSVAPQEAKLVANKELITNRKIKIKGRVSSEIKQVVIFSSNNMDIYRARVHNGNYKADLIFSTPGVKTINIVGLNDKGEVVNNLTEKVNIKQVKRHLINNVPYFYQYNNKYFPDSTCQNTSIAMILNHYGWEGVPDQITKEFGKKKAQRAGGFTEVFNHYARNNNLDIRIRNNVNISPRYIENLLKEGLPVVAHGKFTGSGHIIVLVGYDDKYYYANDPAGKWDQEYKGNYHQRTETNGKYIRYKKSALLDAMERHYGLWIHEVYRLDN